MRTEPSAAMASDKSSKEDAHYQYHSKGTEQCSKCTMFVAPERCTAVEGRIVPNGWCKFFKLARTHSRYGDANG